ncbi:hypothetical protein ACFL1X_14235 [Candidatus Hydrogenedentota bacterium]
MDERHLLDAARYIELNPVRAGLVEGPAEYPWSSAKAHISGQDDPLVRVAALLELVPQWEEYLATPLDSEETETLRSHERTGRPVGDEDFVIALEERCGREIRKKKPGRPRKRAK